MSVKSRPVVVVQLLSRVQLFVTPWTVPCQAPLFMRFPRQEYRSRLPFPSPGDLPDPEIEPASPALQADSLPLSHHGSMAKIWDSGSEYKHLKATLCVSGQK